MYHVLFMSKQRERKSTPATAAETKVKKINWQKSLCFSTCTANLQLFLTAKKSQNISKREESMFNQTMQLSETPGYIINPENNANFLQTKRKPKHFTITISKPNQTQCEKEKQGFDDFKDLSAASQHHPSHSIQRSITAFDSQDRNFAQFCLSGQYSKSLNREYSLKSTGKNQQQMLKSIMSRDSSVKSITSRSQKEVLSPSYKPFEIFFSYRKKSPFMSQRSGSRQSNGQFNSSKHNQKDEGFQTLQTMQSWLNSGRSQTPSFSTGNNDFAMTTSNRHQSNFSQSNSKIFDNSKSLQSYFNQHIKKKIHLNLQPHLTQRPHQSKCSKDHRQYQSYQNLMQTQPRNEDDLNYSSEEEFQAQHQFQTMQVPSSRRISRREFAQQTISQVSKEIQCEPLLQQQQPLQQIFRTYDDSFVCNSGNGQQNKRSCSISPTHNPQLPQQCCHIEGQRHQITRYALEKALKLAEVLMKEVQRLDHIVQSNKYQQHSATDSLSTHPTNNTQDSSQEKEKNEINKVKRELFSEIQNLNRINSEDIEEPRKSTLKKLYTKKKGRRVTGNTADDQQQQLQQSKMMRETKENHNGSLGGRFWYLQQQSSKIIADVTACVQKQVEVSNKTGGMNVNLELKPELSKLYLKLLAEATVSLNQNKGSWRKDIWDYLNKKYQEKIDYRDFLLSIRKFQLEGKVINNEGILNMHPEVIQEVRDKTPTPAFKSRDGKQSTGNIFMKFLNGTIDSQNPKEKQKKKSGRAEAGSIISNSGKQQKTKQAKESVRQSKIDKYFMRKMYKTFQDYDNMKNKQISTKGLGFTTPAPEIAAMQAAGLKNLHIKTLSSEKRRLDQAYKKQLQRQNQHTFKTKAISKQRPAQQLTLLQLAKEQKRIQRQQEKDQAEKDKQAKDEEKKARNLEKQKEIKRKQQDKLQMKVLKALKAQRARKAENKDVNVEEQETQKKVLVKPVISQRSKAIKKTRKNRILQKERKVRVLQGDSEVKLLQKRLRGKTLDLTKLGIIKSKKETEKTLPKKKDEKKLISSRKRPSKIVSRRPSQKEKKRISRPKKQAVTLSLEKETPKTTPKKVKKIQKSSSQKKSERVVTSPEVKRKLANLKRQLFSGDFSTGHIDLDRKAKLDAVKTIRQLFSRKKEREALYIDGKLIYNKMKEEEGIEIVKKIVNDWSKVYINQVFFINKFSNIFNYEVEFSKPHLVKPIPEGTVKVFFSLIERSAGDPLIEFNFENESLKHKLDNTMRTNMFESWIDRVLENKLKIKSLLHLGTEFEYTRTVDEKGKTMDPFVPKFDIIKVKELSKEIRKSQKVNVESPRFINTLKRALYEMFELADKDKSGKLDYQEFYDAFRTLSYGLSENDIKTLIALADENDDGLIDWEEFIPVGIESIQTFFARNKALQRAKAFERDLNKDALQLIYQDEIKKANDILQKKFINLDEQKNGRVALSELKGAMSQSNLIAPKEINIIMRSIKEPTFEYATFPKVLFDVRFELAKSRLMDTNIDGLQKHLIELFAQYDLEQKGEIYILHIQDALLKSKRVYLTPFQIHQIIGLSSPNERGMVNYKDFSFKCKDMINELFTASSLIQKANLIQSGTYKPPESLDDIQLSSLELFKLFKKYDRNQNGFLEIQEYIQCLKENNVQLSEPEIVTLCLNADINGDGRIDYEEFMKHFHDCLKLVRVQQTLQDAYNLYSQQQLKSSSPTRPRVGPTIGQGLK